MQAAVLVGLEDQRADLSEQAELLVGERDEVDGLGSKAVDGAKSDTTEALEDEVSELFSIAKVAIVDKLHQEKYVEEDLALGYVRDLGSALLRAVKLIGDGCAGLDLGSLGWKL